MQPSLQNCPYAGPGPRPRDLVEEEKEPGEGQRAAQR